VKRSQPVIASAVIATIRSFGRYDPSLADDLIQETFVRLYKDDRKALREFTERHANGFYGFLQVVAASVAKDHFRALNAQKRYGERVAGPEELIDLHASRPPNAEQSTRLQEVDRLLSGMAGGQRDRVIFWLYYQQGYTANDIAQLPNVGLSAKGVESCILRMTKIVRSSKGEGPRPTLGEMR